MAVGSDMGNGCRVLALAGGMALAPFLLTAQETLVMPIPGCNAALSCRQKAFMSVNQGAAIGGGVFFGAGFKWGPGFDFFIVGPLGAFSAGYSSDPDKKLWLGGPGNISLLGNAAPKVDGELFHLRMSLLPPPPAVTPVPGLVSVESIRN